MEVFQFIIIIVLITTIGKVLIGVGGPLVDKLGDLAGELAASRRTDRGDGDALDPEVLYELEQRLARIEDRLDFLEELKAPERPRALDRGPGPGSHGSGHESDAHGLDRGGPRGATETGRERSATAEPTAGDP